MPPHLPVMLEDILEIFATAAKESHSDTFADLTFGGGGHTLAILKHFPQSSLVAFDQDPSSFQRGMALLKQHHLSSRCTFYQANFNSFSKKVGPASFAGILADLGISSHHLADPHRGFSFQREGPLDMRMDPENKTLPTAAQLLARKTEEELRHLLSTYGEEPFASRIARAVTSRPNPPQTTSELEELVFHVYPKRLRKRRIHPATKTFQALRIAVNGELDVLKATIPELIPRIAPGGVLAIISFHSLEDRLVKKAFQKAETEGLVDILTKKPLRPRKAEVDKNFRSRSAKLRVVRKKGAPP